MTVRLTSDRELTRLEVLRDLDQRRLTTETAAQLLRLGRRQVSDLEGTLPGKRSAASRKR